MTGLTVSALSADKGALAMDQTRYFKHEDSFWKFEPGQMPQLRTSISPTWGESVFASLEAFLADPAEATEVTALEAEGA